MALYISQSEGEKEHVVSFVLFCVLKFRQIWFSLSLAITLENITALALAALICTVEGECKNDQGRFVFFLLALVITIIEAIVVIIIFVLYLDKKVSSIINLPMTFLLNDSIILLCYFINSTLAMLSIGKCRYKVEARVLAALFAIALFIVYIGLTYTSFRWWEKSNTSKETSNNGSTTITESSPTVLT